MPSAVDTIAPSDAPPPGRGMIAAYGGTDHSGQGHAAST